MRLLDRLMDVLAPRGCASCDEPANSTFCARCGVLQVQRSAELNGVPLLAAGAYTPPLSTAVQRLKYQRRPDLAPQLAELLLPLLDRAKAPRDAQLVPVPLHRRRLVERGFNQTALLAGALARRAGLGWHARGLVRTRETQVQARLQQSERLANVAGGFVASRRLTGRQVILLDDVLTTGATARACIAALEDVDARAVLVLAVCRTGKSSEIAPSTG